MNNASMIGFWLVFQFVCLFIKEISSFLRHSQNIHTHPCIACIMNTIQYAKMLFFCEYNAINQLEDHHFYYFENDFLMYFQFFMDTYLEKGRQFEKGVKQKWSFHASMSSYPWCKWHSRATEPPSGRPLPPLPSLFEIQQWKPFFALHIWKIGQTQEPPMKFCTRAPQVLRRHSHAFSFSQQMLKVLEICTT